MQSKHLDFFSQLRILLKGNVIAQLLPIITLYFAARLYTVNEFALFTSYTTIAQLLSIFASGRYEYAILLPENIKDANAVKLLSLYIVLFSQLLVLLVFLIFTDFFTSIIGIPSIKHWLWTIPITVIFMSVYQVLSYEATRLNQFKIITYSRIQQAVVQSVTRIGLGLMHTGSLGLILSNFLGFFSSCLHYFRNRINFNIPLAELKKVGLRYINFPKYGIIDGFLNTLAMQVPVFAFANFYGLASVGHFGMATRILGLPAAFLALSVGQSYYKSITTNPTETSELTHLLLLKLAKLGLAPLFVAVLLSEQIFPLVLGEEWREAGAYAQILAPWLYLSFVFSPISFLFDAKEQQRYVLYYSLISFVLRSSLLLILFKAGVGIYVNLLVFSLAGVLMWIFFLHKISVLVKLDFKHLAWRIIVIPLLIAVLALLFNGFLIQFILNSIKA